MQKNKWTIIFGLCLIISMIMTSCKPAQTATPTAASLETATQAATATTRKGGWLDEIVFSVVSADSAVTQIEAGAINMYADGLAAADQPTIIEAGLPYVEYNGLQYDILYNPAACADTNILNPFSDPKIREATNWLYDRDYINQEIYAGANLLKYFPITTHFPMYANIADTAATLETYYAYNLDKAKEIIDEQMISLGAEKDANDKWTYKGKLVNLDFLIRSDSDGTRKPIGDYVSSQLEAIGFTVNRQYKTSTESGPIWQSSIPSECQWTLYTAAWSATIIDREEKTLFQAYYTPESTQGIEPFTSATPDPAFEALANRLANGEYSSLEERNQMIAEALPMAMKDSLQVWLIDGKAFVPYSSDVQVSYDLAAGIQGAQIWPFTIRFKDQEGGIMKIGQQDLFGQPFNPIGGSNWAYDQMAIRAASSGGTMNDPYTGLVWPLNIESATVTVQNGIPVSKSLDWVTLETADKIEVPTDTFVDWDAKAQTFITAGTKFPEGSTAKVRSVVVYPKDLYDRVTWHDGNHIDAADFVMGMIMTFDRANPDSAIYDDQAVPNFQAFMQTFKGFRITSTDPLTVEWYTDGVFADAELDVYAIWPGANASGFSPYAFGEGAWDVLTVANLAEAAGELAYTTDKSTAKEVEWTNFLGGPSLEILAKYLDTAIADKYVPYAATLGQYITPDYAVERYTNLKNWYAAHNHFWIDTGPYYVDRAYMTEKTLSLKHFDAYPDLADRWSNFGEPKIAAVALDGPTQVKIGEQAEFTIAVSFKNAPYPSTEVSAVKFLIFDANNTIVATANAEYVGEGQYKVLLTSDMTSKLATGSNKLTVSVVVTPVAIPTFTSINFITIAP